MAITRRAALKTLVATGVGTFTGTAAFGFLYGRHHLELTKLDLPINRLPAGLDGLRVGMLTDIHRSRWVSHDDVAAAVSMLMREQPDLIVLGGDYVTWGDRQFVAPAADALAPLSAPHGVFGILGNHDDDHDMPAALGRNGVNILKDARTRIYIRREPLDIVGIRYWTRRQADIAALLRDASRTTLLLAHDPRRLTEAAALNVPIVLAGHTHGGQVILPVVGNVAAQKFSPPVPVMSGVGRRGNTTMFVSRGIGTVYLPIRINCPPEVAVLTLRTM